MPDELAGEHHPLAETAAGGESSRGGSGEIDSRVRLPAGRDEREARTSQHAPALGTEPKRG